MTKIKICGIRSRQEALWAANAGAWAVGFVFAPSRRRVSMEEAAAIIRELPANIHKVGVFVDMKISSVQEIISATGIDFLQFHGEESPAYCQEFDLPIIKSFLVEGEDSLDDVVNYNVFAHLFDTYTPNSRGGSGQTFDWRCLNILPAVPRVILAGGLNPQNVNHAIQETKPFAVDVSSGVEIAGRKDCELINEFISQVTIMKP